MNFFLGLFNRLGCRALLAMLVPIVLAACGGSGAGGQGAASASSIGGLGGTAGQEQIQLTSDKTVLASNRTTPVQLTAVVVDGNGVSVPSRPITWQVVDPVSPAGVRLDGTSAKTDTAGKSTASLVLSGDQSNRTVQVTVTSSGVSATTSISIAGTSIAISGPQTVPLNAQSSRFNLSLVDSSGLGIGGKTLTVKSQAGNQILQGSSVVTDVSGKANVDVIGTVGGNDTISASGLGAAFSFPVTVAGEALQVIPATSDIAIGGTGTTITVNYTKNGGIAPGTNVSLTSTRGTVTPATASIVSGSATFTASSTTAGPVTFAAIVGTTQGVANAQFVATVPGSIDLQATPTIIGPNQPGQTAERSQLVAVVRDTSGNPVKGQIVAFTNPQDASGGSIDPPSSISDASGRATSTFIAGAQATPPNGVILRAQVVGTAFSSQATLSVSRSQLFVRIGNGGKIVTPTDVPIYQAQYAVIVTDSTGNPVQNANVQLRITPTFYWVGQYCKFNTTTGICDDATGSRWHYNGRTYASAGPPTTPPPLGTFYQYVSEDTNRNGVCDVGEDKAPGPAGFSLDRHLTPGNVASVTSSVTTDQYGTALVLVSYPRQFATWVNFNLEATLLVGGSEGSATLEDVLEAPATEFSDVSVNPGWLRSPFPYSADRPTCP